MRSPFPGMDPYLERHWRDVHHRLTTYACDRLRVELPGDLRARLEERIFIEHENGRGHHVYPDVRVFEHPHRPAGTTRISSVEEEGGVAVAEPLLVHLKDEPCAQGYIEVIEVGSGGRVITVIEFLSPSNKAPGEGRDLYLRKREGLKAGGVNLVEIDLTRAGKRTLLVEPERIPASHHTPYQACVWRSWNPIVGEVYGLPLQDRLPVIRIPLRERDKPAPLDLQSLIDQCYENGGYDTIDYRVQPDPPLAPEDAAWADGLLRGRGLRG